LKWKVERERERERDSLKVMLNRERKELSTCITGPIPGKESL